MKNDLKSPSRMEQRIIVFMILLGLLSVGNFLFHFFQPSYRGHKLLFVLLTVSILYSVSRLLYMWYNYSSISVGAPRKSHPDFKVDILTTFFPGEPYAMITNTLKAIEKISYPHTTYLCDEANDPFLKDFCQELGILHVTRSNRKDAKAGNINNALKNLATGEICVILDPDHIPEPDFLDRVLPYFEDPTIGFVQVVQSYYNVKESLVARGAAEQTFEFYGPFMMSLNTYGAVNAIGANCTFRRIALDSIGGHAPGLCEDMHTAMLLYSKKWKAVYVPSVFTKGLAPSNLTNFFQQQLKWARGTFDLLLNVYPRIFNNLSIRQKLHFGILPLHFLGGLVCLINFLIPILSLLLSRTPWQGDFIDFSMVLAPVVASSFLIRAFIQKWLIERKERGFHIIGGLLYLNTWWIYILAFVYTLFGKKVPYLPTPKEDSGGFNIKIIIPNIMVALTSIYAIIYGLRQDFTPFSLAMAGFALFNALIMLWGIYFAYTTTNQNKILRTHLKPAIVAQLQRFKKKTEIVTTFMFENTRRLAFPVLLVVFGSSLFYNQQKASLFGAQPPLHQSAKLNSNFLGIYQPKKENGLTFIPGVDSLEKTQQVNFDIISNYIAWTDESIENFPYELMDSIFEKNALPMITWEPWGSGLEKNAEVKELKEEKKVFKYITNGHFDDYLRSFSKILKSYDKPFFLRFAHEFDNPHYSWSHSGENSPEEFIAAWRYVYNFLAAEEVEKVIFVWNPWKAENMASYYPGDEFVDWVGMTALNYGTLYPDQEAYSFSESYQVFREQLHSFTNKPVMLAEFGSLKGTGQSQWIREALLAINTEFEEIRAIIYFNSGFDQNIPDNTWYDKNYLDWTTDSIEILEKQFEQNALPPPKITNRKQSQKIINKTIPIRDLRGVNFKKGIDWKNNYHVLNKESLVEDFKMIRETGFNSITYFGGNVYDYNVLRYSKKFDLQLIYKFKEVDNLDFISDQKLQDDLQQQIIKKVKDLRNQENILAYSFSYKLETTFQKPLEFQQISAYLNWLSDLVNEIKTIDPEKLIIVELPLNPNTGLRIKKMDTLLPVDSYGLQVEDTTYLSDLLEITKSEKITVHISQIAPELLLENYNKFKDLNLVLENWQDIKRSDRITFDGLLDFNGRKKWVLKEVKNIWTEQEVLLKEPKFRILKPSEPLRPGKTYTYNALLFENQEWIIPLYSKRSLEFEWNLVKKNQYGDALSIDRLGKGASIDLRIPEGYKFYELVLTAKEKDHVITQRSQLHTPSIRK